MPFGACDAAALSGLARTGFASCVHFLTFSLNFLPLDRPLGNLDDCSCSGVWRRAPISPNF